MNSLKRTSLVWKKRLDELSQAKQNVYTSIPLQLQEKEKTKEDLYHGLALTNVAIFFFGVRCAWSCIDRVYVYDHPSCKCIYTRLYRMADGYPLSKMIISIVYFSAKQKDGHMRPSPALA